MTAAPTIALAERHAVAQRCRVIVARCLKLLHREVTVDDDFAADLAADSLDMVTIAMAVEEEFGVDIPDDIAAECITVSDMVDAVMERLR